MKTFVFSVIILGLLIAVIIGNGYYVRNVTTKTQDTLLALPTCAQAQEDAQALLAHWQKEKPWLELSVSATDINEFENRLVELCVASRFKKEEAFERARALCLLSITRIQDLKRFTFLHIL